MPLIDPQLKEILRCPNCHGDLAEDEAQARLRCVQCGYAYPVRDGIPVMLIEEADKPAAPAGAANGAAVPVSDMDAAPVAPSDAAA